MEYLCVQETFKRIPDASYGKEKPQGAVLFYSILKKH